MHVKNLPAALASIEGLCSSDLKGLQLNYCPDNNSYICGSCTNTNDAVDTANKVTQDIEQVVASLEAEMDFSVFDVGAPANQSQSAQGFQGHPF